MSLQDVLDAVEPAWYATDANGVPIEPDVLARARASRLGRRMLASWLAQGPAQAIFAPHPNKPLGQIAAQWPRELLTRLARDVGVLAYAPAIRAEVARNSVKRLKQALGNSYLLALDRTVWDGKVEPGLLAGLTRTLFETLAGDGQSNDALYGLFETQGRNELRAWAQRHDPALGEWIALTHPPAPVEARIVLPAAQVQMLCAHHLSKPVRPAPPTASPAKNRALHA